MSSSQSNILIVGGAGYIGSHLALMLQDQGHNVTVLDNLELGHREVVYCEFLKADLRDPASLKKVFEGRTFSTIYHFAAFSLVGESVTKPTKYFQNNVVGTANLLEVARQHGLEKLVFSSTCATYGNPQYLPLDEKHPQNPINPYGQSKLIVEQMLEGYRQEFGIATGILRYFNAAGADPKGRSGEYHDPESHLIPLAIMAAEGTGKPLTIFGDDYDTPDGTCVRDYIHVNDLARAHILTAEKLSKGEKLVYNLGSGNGYSVRQIIEAVSRLGGKPVPHSIGPRREGDPASLIAASGKSLKELGWKTEIGLDDIVLHAINALKNDARVKN